MELARMINKRTQDYYRGNEGSSKRHAQNPTALIKRHALEQPVIIFFVCRTKPHQKEMMTQAGTFISAN
eukprot:gene26283-biopygen15548